MTGGEIIKFNDFIMEINHAPLHVWGIYKRRYVRNPLDRIYEAAFFPDGGVQANHMHYEVIQVYEFLLKHQRLRQKRVYFCFKQFVKNQWFGKEQVRYHQKWWKTNKFERVFTSSDRDRFLALVRSPDKHYLLTRNVLYGQAHPTRFHLNPYARHCRLIAQLK